MKLRVAQNGGNDRLLQLKDVRLVESFVSFSPILDFISTSTPHPKIMTPFHLFTLPKTYNFLSFIFSPPATKIKIFFLPCPLPHNYDNLSAYLPVNKNDTFLSSAFCPSMERTTISLQPFPLFIGKNS